MRPTSECRPSRANVLGVGIAAVNMEQALAYAGHLLERRQRGYICATGVHGIMEARRDERFRRILNRSFLCIPDGMPTVWVGHWQGLPDMRRVYGPDFMLALCERSVARGYRHFLYGGGDGVAEKLRGRLQKRVPGLNIAGTYTPPFRKLTTFEQEEVAIEINQSRADVVWVGISTPKQERFMAGMISRLNCRLMVGVGAAFDLHAGLTQDAPAWMKNCGLQWLDRLAKEPKRLWRRYLTNNPQFVWEVARQMTGLKEFEIETY